MAVINGTSGSETLNGTAESDNITGGAGIDTLAYTGKAADYRFDLSNGALIVTDINATDTDDGTDQVFEIEQLQFADHLLQVRLGGEIQVSTSYDPFSTPALTMLPDEGWLITWESRYGEYGRAILTQRYDSSGQKIGEETIVGPASGEISPSTVVLPDGGWLVTWINNENVFTQRYDSTGSPDGSAALVYDAAMNWSSSSASVTALSEDGWVVTWQSEETGHSGNIYTQRYDAHGSPLSGPTQVNTTPGYESAAATAALADGGWLVTYGNRLGDLFFQRYDRTGIPQGGETRVNHMSPINSEQPAISPLPDGGWVIAWKGPLDDDSDGIAMQRYDAQGNPTGESIPTIYNMGNPQLTTLPDGGWLVIASGVYIKRYDASGNPTGSVVQIAEGTYPNATALPDGGWVLAYQSHNGSLSYKRFDAQGIEQTLTIQGTDGDDTLNGGTAGLTLAGGTGDDLYVIGIDDVSFSVVGVLGRDGKIHYDAPEIREFGSEGVDTVYSYLGSYTLPDNVENGRIYTNLPSDGWPGGTRGGNLNGNNLDNVLFANDGDNALEGGAGADTASYAYSSKAVTITLGMYMSYTGGSGYDTLSSIENLVGSNYGDTLHGDSRNNTFDGGLGTDTVSYANATGPITVNLAITNAQETGGAGLDTLISIENLTGTDHNDRLTGNSARNTLNGGGGNDILNGGAGADTLIGSYGSDTYYVDDAGDKVTETSNPSDIDSVYSYLTAYSLGSNIENGRILSTGTANLTGNSLNNVLYAGAGNNILNGDIGTDTVSYGYGSSAVTVSLASTKSQVTGGSGSDTLVGIENLTGSAYNDSLTGSSATNKLNGGHGDDTINGGAAADNMIGGDGSDIYFVDNAGDVVTETNADLTIGGTDTVNSYLSQYTLGANIENGRVMASGAANMTGNNLNNIIFAGAGNNALNGGSGNDTLSYLYASSAVTVSLASTVAQATGGSGTDTLSAFENLNGSNYNDNLTGNAGSNKLRGGLGNDVLNGGAGADNMVGGDGSDTYYIDHLGDLASETNADASIGGIDSVLSYLASHTLGTNIEHGRILASGTANLAGNTLGNVLTAGSGNNILNGGGGIDAASYAYATSAVTVSLANTSAQITGGSGSDALLSIENLVGSNYNDTLTGNAANNKLNGGAGNDRLIGGAGKDVLVGGSGNDIFAFSSLSDTGLTSDSWDVINDFVRGTDKIDLSKLDANTATSGDNTFNMIIDGTAAFTAARQLKVFNGVLYGNTDGDSDAEFAIQLIGVSSVSLADFIA